MTKFWVFGNRVSMTNGEISFNCSIQEFLQFEPDFRYVSEAGVLEIWTPERHSLVVDGNQKSGEYLGDRSVYLAKLDDYISRYQVFLKSEAEAIASASTNWAGFRHWRYTFDPYLTLLASHPGLTNALENAIAYQDWDSAFALWSRLKQSGAITVELVTGFHQAVSVYNLPQALVDALAAS